MAQCKMSIVLPFANMSGDPEQEYFSDGMRGHHDGLIENISARCRRAQHGLRLQGPERGREGGGEGCSRSLVLEGSVRKAGNRIRINAQLIDGSTGKHLWADRFDRDLTDVFEIQDQMSKAIVDALQLRLLPQEEKRSKTAGPRMSTRPLPHGETAVGQQALPTPHVTG